MSNSNRGLYLIRGPFPGKGNRAYVIVSDDGKRRKINYAKFLLMKEGKEFGRYDVVHHKDGNKYNDKISNLEIVSEHKHKQIHTAKKYKRSK